MRNLNYSLWLEDRAEPPKLALRYLSHPDAQVRAVARNMVAGSRASEDAATAFADMGWRWNAGMDGDEAATGSILLLRAKPRRGSRVLDRADPQIAVEAFLDDPSEAPRLEAFLRDEIDHVLKRDIKFSSNRFWCRRAKVRAFVEAYPDIAAELVKPVMASGPARGTSLFMGFPVVELCAGLLRHRPDAGAALWKSLFHEERDGMTKSSQLVLMPFEVERSPLIDELRASSLGAATNDHDLASIADMATRKRDDGWVEQIVVRDLASPSATVIARALVLAGFMHDVPSARVLWSEPLATSPAGGWLAGVHASARAAFQRHLDAMEWLELALEAKDIVQASAMHLLFLSAADVRSVVAGQRRVEQARKQMSRGLIIRWNLGLRKFEQRESEDVRQLTRLMCTTPISTSAAPWA